MTDNVASTLCYVLGLITGILFLVLAPYNQNKIVRFHAFQSIFLHLSVIAFWILWMIVEAVLGILSFSSFLITIASVLIGILSFVIGLGFFGLWIFMMYKAYNNQKVVLPVIGPLAEKQA